MCYASYSSVRLNISSEHLAATIIIVFTYLWQLLIFRWRDARGACTAFIRENIYFKYIGFDERKRNNFRDCVDKLWGRGGVIEI